MRVGQGWIEIIVWLFAVTGQSGTPTAVSPPLQALRQALVTCIDPEDPPTDRTYVSLRTDEDGAVLRFRVRCGEVYACGSRITTEWSSWHSMTSCVDRATTATLRRDESREKVDEPVTESGQLDESTIAWRRGGPRAGDPTLRGVAVGEQREARGSAAGNDEQPQFGGPSDQPMSTTRTLYEIYYLAIFVLVLVTGRWIRTGMKDSRRLRHRFLHQRGQDEGQENGDVELENAEEQWRELDTLVEELNNTTSTLMDTDLLDDRDDTEAREHDPLYISSTPQRGSEERVGDGRDRQTAAELRKIARVIAGTYLRLFRGGPAAARGLADHRPPSPPPPPLADV